MRRFESHAMSSPLPDGTTIRNATIADLDQIVAVEESWPESGRATPDKFVARIRRFPRGFFVAESAGRIYATITSCPFRYDPADLRELSTWSQITRDGYLQEQYDLSACNAIYIVSGVIDKAHRGSGIFAPMVERQVALAQALRLQFVVAGAFIPGYADYCREHGEMPAGDYAFLAQGRRLVDPLLQMYSTIGFAAPDKRHIVANYFPDAGSLNYAALVVRRV